jgi:ferredoxin
MAEVVPFVDGKDPIGVGLATISTEMFIALALSVLIQKRLGYHRWRRMHAWAYVAFTLVGAHALISGSDMGPWYAWGTVAVAWAVTVIARLAVTRWMTAIPRAATNRMTTRLRGREVAVNVDPGRCVRFGFCEQEAPEVFRLRGDGRLTYRPSVPADDAESVIRAAQACPARAVVLSRLATSMVMPAGVTPKVSDAEAEPAGGARRRRVG